MLFYCCKILTAFNKLEIMADIALLICNTDIRQQAEDYVRCCSTFIIYGQPSTRWRLGQRLFYFYDILTDFNLLKNMSDVVLLLLYTDSLQHGEDYVRGCSTSTTIWQPSTSWRICQMLFYCCKILTAFNKLEIRGAEIALLLCNTDIRQQAEDYVRCCSTFIIYGQPSTRWRLCQRFFYFYKILTAFNNLRIKSEVVLHLRNTDSIQQVEEYVSCCSTFIIYGLPLTSWRLCQRLFYFYKILTAFKNLKISSNVVLLLWYTERI